MSDHILYSINNKIKIIYKHINKNVIIHSTNFGTKNQKNFNFIYHVYTHIYIRILFT